MPITQIEIRNVKGIQHKIINQEIIPNRPSILVAPNGFGKSSLAVAFKSMISTRIRLSDDDLFEHDANNRPSLEVRYKKPDNTIQVLRAGDNENTIAGEFDYFVINNQIRAKGHRVQVHGGATNVSASLHIDDLILVNTIPPNVTFGYSINEEKIAFGQNGKILENISNLFTKESALKTIAKNYLILDKFQGVRLTTAVDQQKAAINGRTGGAAQLKLWAEANVLPTFEAQTALHDLGDLLTPFFTGFSRLEVLLSGLQLTQLYKRNRKIFKDALTRKLYEIEREEYEEAFAGFNSTWKNIRPRQRGTQLIVEFPKAHMISNGQRDVLCFVTLLEQAKNKLKKQKSILIIDEVFDYLDDANLVVAQFYVTKLINKFKNEGREIYPLILSHLDPYYFKSFLFAKLKAYYLDARPSAINTNMRNLITKREDPSIKDDVSKYLLHYHTNQINKQADFATLQLHQAWATGNAFDTFVQNEIQKYFNNQSCDPFAVCCGIRKRIEENVYNEIPNAGDKITFLSTHMTRNKLDFAESIGVSVPEYYYLLGIIYNSGMHWINNIDNETPIIIKLENRTLKQLIRKVFV